MTRYEIETDGVRLVPNKGVIGPGGKVSSLTSHPAKTSLPPVSDGQEVDARCPVRRQPPADYVLPPEEERPTAPAWLGVVILGGLLFWIVALLIAVVRLQ